MYASPSDASLVSVVTRDFSFLFFFSVNVFNNFEAFKEYIFDCKGKEFIERNLFTLYRHIIKF